MRGGLRVAFSLALGASLLSGCPSTPKAPTGHALPPADGVIVTCPVSRASCQKGSETPSAIYESRTYYFCCPECPKRFAEEPARYADVITGAN